MLVIKIIHHYEMVVDHEMVSCEMVDDEMVVDEMVDYEMMMVDENDCER